VPFEDRDAAGIGTLADPMRRRLYLFVCAQADPVSRDQAADAVGIPLHQAKFHLDKLEKEGLLDTEYARVGGRSGPGAGRTSKMYRRATRDIAVSLPDREYQLAGRLMADAIAESASSGRPVVDALRARAHTYGRALASATQADPPATARSALELATKILTAHGYEPRPEDSRVIMVNCPFHALAQAQTDLVCRMNYALITGVTDAISAHNPIAELEPGPHRCCVVLRERRD
jgi:predicted ArsR family transcriptional regulator